MIHDLDALFATPDAYLFAFDGDQALFRTMDREAYQRSIFLDRRICAANATAFAVPIEQLIAFNRSRPTSTTGTRWIFHIAHCGSTLLAHALDRPDASLVLREPLALRQLGIEPHRGQEWQERLELAITLLARRYAPQAPAVVKANVPVNFIASDILARDPLAPAICLYFPFRSHLLAVLRSDSHRTWIGNVTKQLASKLQLIAGDVTALDIPERAAALWLAEMRIYADLIARAPNVRSLHAEDLFDQPRPVLAAAAALFGIALREAELEASVAGPLFATYAKLPHLAFDNSMRLSQRAEGAARLQPELGRALNWLERRLADHPLPNRLGKPLVGSAPDLLE